jgi:hypothetical protein
MKERTVKWDFLRHIEPDLTKHREGMGSVVALDGDTMAIAAVYDTGMSAGGEYSPGQGRWLSTIGWVAHGDIQQYSGHQTQR